MVKDLKPRNTRDLVPIQSVLPPTSLRPSKDHDGYVNQIFEGEANASPRNVFRDPLGHPFKVISSPKILNSRQKLEDLTRFRTKIRRAIIRRDQKIFVDLSPCQSIDVGACVLLAAELHRCQSLAGDYLYGCDPAASEALNVLRGLGFHELLKIRNPAPAPRSEWIARIRAGHGTDQEIPRVLDEIAELAMSAWGDEAFRNQILAALNEAMTNVIMHAYPSEIQPNEYRVAGAWWAAGIVNPDTNEAWFFAFDQGVGLPKTALRNFDGILERHGLNSDSPADHEIIAATILEAHTRTGLGQHGLGLPAMIRLIDEKAVGGSIAISSLRGEHMIVKNPTNPDARLRRVEFGRALDAEIPGTLIVWKVDGPIAGSDKEGGDV